MDTPVRPGDVLLGKYSVEHVLGQGGMGIVLAARHLDLGELFAIKLLLPDMLGHSEVLERFLREARAAARLRSEHVARVHDFGRMENGAPYMVMEYLDGRDLKAVIRSQGPLPIEEAVTYVLQACDATAEAHGLGLVHRDLKPANLFLIRRPNGSPCVKVLDFGISKRTGPDAVDLTATGRILGSPLYMSPEQMACAKGVDVRADIWAMGVVLYELLVGRAPFMAQTITEVVSRVLLEEPTPPSQLRPDLPPAVEAVILRCLRKRPEERIQSIAELASALRAAMGLSDGAGFGPLAVRSPAPSSSAIPAITTGETAPVQVGTSQPTSTLRMLTIPLPPPAAAQGASPGSGSTPGEATGAAWGRTGGAAGPRGGGRRVVIMGAAVGLAVLGAGAWIAMRGPSEQPAPASSSGLAVETPPVAEVAERPASVATTIASAEPPPKESAPMAIAPQEIAAPPGSSAAPNQAPASTSSTVAVKAPPPPRPSPSPEPTSAAPPAPQDASAKGTSSKRSIYSRD
ncbi:serine/threonine protein kinase [Polyangium aurulentum]|uniref:serine/threonine protein kinase n=1 Tax=Polyangium aurulentum TaxID=2567896 RepID=UPI0010AE2D3D|nr:serine/threonine-protein kinase [Polyangium aurulentum]UQA57843.1 protein kinase [Polyangium aurulentum]